MPRTGMRTRFCDMLELYNYLQAARVILSISKMWKLRLEGIHLRPCSTSIQTVKQ